jgi:hypothetical protein
MAREDEMALSDHVIALVEELDRVHPKGIADWQVRKPGEFPNFVTAENGQVRLFTPLALKELAATANLLYDNDADWKAAAERRRNCIPAPAGRVYFIKSAPVIGIK